MKTNPLNQLSELGQSIWLDDIHRGMLTGGEMQTLIRDDSVSGITSNPSILQKAVSEHNEYAEQAQRMMGSDLQVPMLYEALILEDISRAADLLLPIYEDSQKRDGYVSLEVSPHLAHDTEATIAEARRLWQSLQRPNVMIKVPATREGLPAMNALVAEGININATLIFSIERYREVAQAYLQGLQARHQQGGDISHVASVASFFISRIDTKVDDMLPELEAKAAVDEQHTHELKGQAAIATARLAYQSFRQIREQSDWQALEQAGAMPQRLLWASTSTKDPEFSDVKYVEALIGTDTVNTVPRATLEAYRDHGQPALRVEDGLDAASAVLETLSYMGVDMKKVADELEAEGVKKFEKAFDALYDAIGSLAQRLRA